MYELAARGVHICELHCKHCGCCVYCDFNVIGDGCRKVMFAWRTGMMSCILVTSHRDTTAILLIWCPMQLLANQSSKSVCGNSVRYSTHSDAHTSIQPGLT